MSKITGISGWFLILPSSWHLRKGRREELVLNLGEIVALPKDGREEQTNERARAVGEGADWNCAHRRVECRTYDLSPGQAPSFSSFSYSQLFQWGGGPEGLDYIVGSTTLFSQPYLLPKFNSGRERQVALSFFPRPGFMSPSDPRFVFFFIFQVFCARE